jgi:hypothetical protein
MIVEYDGLTSEMISPCCIICPLPEVETVTAHHLVVWHHPVFIFSLPASRLFVCIYSQSNLDTRGSIIVRGTGYNRRVLASPLR